MVSRLDQEEQRTQKAAAKALLGQYMQGRPTPAVMIVGYDPRLTVWIFITALPVGEATAFRVWRNELEKYEFPADGYGSFALAAAALQLWPEIQVFDAHCLCCCSGLHPLGKDQIGSYLTA